MQRLLGDAGIVRHRGKIEATIANARATVALSKALKRAGFRFVGPTTVYSTMQACGVVNDHLVDCHVRDAVERERR